MPLEAPGRSNPLDQYADAIRRISVSNSHLDDASSYATAWTTNFIGRYQSAEHDNDDLLAVYLSQRFDELTGASS
jgi:hypothetical protein